MHAIGASAFPDFFQCAGLNESVCMMKDWLRRSHLYKVIALCLTIGYASSTTTYTRQGDTSLTVIPFDEIPDSTGTVELDNCAIEDFDYFPFYPSLGTLSMKGNRLTVLPDLSNITDSLLNLYLNENNISYVDPTRLDALINLEHLTMGDNNYLTQFPDCTVPGGIALNHLTLTPVPLDEFPDFACLGKSLEWLKLSGFKFNSIPDSRLLRLGKLRSLYVTSGDLTEFPRADLLNNTLQFLSVLGTKLTEVPTDRIPVGTLSQFYVTYIRTMTTIPNLCSIMPPGSRVYGKYMRLVCDCRLLWILDAIAIGTITVHLTGTSCISPPNLDGMLVSDLTHSDLQCNAGDYP